MKAELVKQMNDLEFLTQSEARKSDIAVAKRMDWMRGIGIYAKRQTVARNKPPCVRNTANNRCRLKSHKTKTFRWSSPAMGA